MELSYTNPNSLIIKNCLFQPTLKKGTLKPRMSSMSTPPKRLMILAWPTISSNQSSMVAFFPHHSSGPLWVMLCTAISCPCKIYSADTEITNLTKYLIPQLLNHGIIGILMGGVESAMNWTSIRVLVAWGEDLVLVQTPVLIIDSIIKSDDNHLRNICRKNSARNKSSIRRAEAVWECTIWIVTRRSSVWVMGWVAPTLVTVVLTVWVPVTEQFGWKAGPRTG